MKIVCILLMVIMLGGCAKQPAMETVNDQWVEVVAPCRELSVKLPPDAAAPVLQSTEAGELYQCDGYVVLLQTFPGGDLDATLRQVTGFSRQQLSCIESGNEDVKRYSCVWSSAGEGGDYVGRAEILDDGSYHYAVSVMAQSAESGKLTKIWQEILSSVSLSDTD